VRLRQIAPVGLVLALTVAGFLVAHLLGERDARRESEHRAEVAAAQIRGRVEQGASLAESLRRFMVGVGGRGVTDAEFETTASRWLSPAGFPAAAWVEEVSAGERARYERRVGVPIVTRDPQGNANPVPARSSYLPATLASGIPPTALAGVDLAGAPGIGAALARARSLYDAGATPLSTLQGSKGLFLIQFAPRLVDGIVESGYVAVFVPELWLRAAATEPSELRLTVGGTSTGGRLSGAVAGTTFSEAGQRFEVAVPRLPVGGAAAALPWIILAAGLVLAALAAALAVNAARRARAQEELDRIFSLTPDLITVSDFDGRFTRVNPAVEEILGYTQAEVVDRPYLDLVHPEDRQRTVVEAAEVGEGKTTLSFENRYMRKDGAPRTLQWTAAPLVREGVVYSVARDVTERREAEAELERLADEQAALLRVATLVARGVPAAELFEAIADEVSGHLDAESTAIGRLEPDGTMAIVAGSGRQGDLVPDRAFGDVVRTGQSARVGTMVAVPIMVEGSLWGSIVSGTGAERFPPDAEQRMTEFTELAATAIANAEGRSALRASRARVVAASDETRRQIERDLHDGAQQRLVHTVITLKLARRVLSAHDDAAARLLEEALDHAEQATVELRELVQGILPPVLTRGGLAAAIETLAARTPVPVELDISAERLSAPIEATAYFVVAEALTNVAKHSHASHATVLARVEGGTLRIEVRDDGVGGARADGHGFVGLADRLAVHDGHLHVESPAGRGTLVVAEIPSSD
jgi:PAS domain S-box-containing protein